jgi:hypothetical protein
MYRGLLGYFPAALFRVAAHSFRSDRKHNPEKPESESPHWAREKSPDHLDCIMRHLAELHTDPNYHACAIAWRALAYLQELAESQGATPGCRSVFASVPQPAKQWVIYYRGTQSTDLPCRYDSRVNAEQAIYFHAPYREDLDFYEPVEVSK